MADISAASNLLSSLNLNKEFEAYAKYETEAKNRKVEQAAKTKLISSVTVNEADVAILMNDFKLARVASDKLLREHNGSLEQAVDYLLSH